MSELEKFVMDLEVRDQTGNQLWNPGLEGCYTGTLNRPMATVADERVSRSAG